MKEEFKEIEGYEGLYKVSNTGKVYSILNNIILKTVKRKAAQTQYEYLTLVKNGVKKTCTVHRLVAKAFLSNPENKATVNHIDNNGLNNNVNNLEWCTYSENLKHAQKQGRLYEAQRKGGLVATQIAQRLAAIDAANMVGKTYQNWEVKELKGTVSVGKAQIQRYQFVCRCKKCGCNKLLVREYLKTLKEECCRECSSIAKSLKRYNQVCADVIGKQINQWQIKKITETTGQIRSCKVLASCSCGADLWLPYAALESLETRKCKCCGR